MPEGEDTCLYCGARIGAFGSSEGFKTISRRKTTATSKGLGGHAVIHEISEKKEVYDKLDDLPAHLRSEIAEALKKEGDTVVVDSRISIGVGPDSNGQDDDMALQFSLGKPSRPRRLHPLTLFLIFLGSTALVAVVMWLMM
jgi:hypothetical protein